MYLQGLEIPRNTNRYVSAKVPSLAQAHSPGSSGGVSSTGGAVNIMHDRRVVRGNTYGRNNAHLRSNWSVTPNDDVIKQRQAERNG